MLVGVTDSNPSLHLPIHSCGSVAGATSSHQFMVTLLAVQSIVELSIGLDWFRHSCNRCHLRYRCLRVGSCCCLNRSLYHSGSRSIRGDCHVLSAPLVVTYWYSSCTLVLCLLRCCSHAEFFHLSTVTCFWPTTPAIVRLRIDACGGSRLIIMLNPFPHSLLSLPWLSHSVLTDSASFKQ
jgi:hypothetical protein